MNKLSERMLRKWRKEALKAVRGDYPEDASVILFEVFCNRILQTTRELLDNHLVKE